MKLDASGLEAQKQKHSSLDKIERLQEVLLILERPFLATSRALINVKQDKLILQVGEKETIFNVFKAMKHSQGNESYWEIGVTDHSMSKIFK